MVMQGEKETIINLIDWGPVLGNASLGVQVGQEIKKHLLSTDKGLVLNFSKVRTITGAFIQGCFGGLVEEFGKEVLGERIACQNLNTSTASLIQRDRKSVV